MIDALPTIRKEKIHKVRILISRLLCPSKAGFSLHGSAGRRFYAKRSLFFCRIGFRHRVFDMRINGRMVRKTEILLAAKILPMEEKIRQAQGIFASVFLDIGHLEIGPSIEIRF